MEVTANSGLTLMLCKQKKVQDMCSGKIEVLMQSCHLSFEV